MKRFFTGITLGLLIGALLTAGAVFTWQSFLSFEQFRPAKAKTNTYTPQLVYTDQEDFSSDITPSRMIDPDQLVRVREDMSERGERFIWADLSEMTVSLYDGEQIVETLPILTRGRPDSWWDTPSGIYRVGTMEEEHLSSIGGVYMPWSIQFQGNFFIHGWPYYPDGTPVESDYSGGCIRMSIVDSKHVYEFAETGMIVIVSDTPQARDNYHYALPNTIPDISANAYIVADLANGFILYDHESDARHEIGHLNSLSTALVAGEYIYLGRDVTIRDPEDLHAQASPFLLVPGEQMMALDLLYPLLLQSSDVAAYSLATSLGSRYYRTLMNRQAEALLMSNTEYGSVLGNNEESKNISTARDLLQLMRYIYEKRQFIFDISRGKSFDYFGRPQLTDISNENDIFSPSTKALGGRVVDAGDNTYHASMVFWLSTREGEKRPVAIILLGSDDPPTDVDKILGEIQRTYF